MKNCHRSTEDHLGAHSQAKIELLKRYLAVYFNVLSRTPFIKNILIFDLCAGEGRYADGSAGSPIVIIEQIIKHFKSHTGNALKVDILLNDSEKSQIQPDKYKIERVRQEIDKIEIPPEVKVHYWQKDFEIVFPKVKQRITKLSSSQRALLFIDPWGYKFIKPKEIADTVMLGRNEILLFLPTSHMYRFSKKSQDDETYAAGKPLRQFLKEISNGKKLKANSPMDFIHLIKQAFRDCCNMKYSDTFTIQRDEGSYFSLFFFTTNQVGFRKMLESKWALDAEEGKGYSIPKAQQKLNFGCELDEFGEKLLSYIEKEKLVLNHDLYEFGLLNGYLPKHLSGFLKKWEKVGIIQISDLDHKPRKGLYLDNKDRRIGFKIADQ